MQDVLSREELDFLLAPQPQPEPISASLSPQAWEQRLALAWAQNLSSLLGSALTITCLPAKNLDCETFLASLAQPACLSMLALDPLQARALLSLDLALASTLIDLSLGAGTRITPEKNAILTPLDQALLRRCLETLPPSLAQSFSPQYIKPHLLFQSTKVSDIFLTSPETPLHITSLYMETSLLRSTCLLALPADAVPQG